MNENMMNESEREELERLKTRHAELRIEFAKFGYRLDAFELRLAKSAETAVPPTIAAAAPFIEPPKPVVPPPIPIPARIQPFIQKC